MRRLRTAIRMVGMVGLLAALVLADGSAVANQHGDSETAREQEPDADSTDEPESLDASRAREPVDDSRASEPDDAPVFVPPNRGAPRRLVGAATRGGEPGEAAGVAALVPQATGYTLRARPVLYWYAFERMAGPCELTLVADNPTDEVEKVAAAT